MRVIRKKDHKNRRWEPQHLASRMRSLRCTLPSAEDWQGAHVEPNDALSQIAAALLLWDYITPYLPDGAEPTTLQVIRMDIEVGMSLAKARYPRRVRRLVNDLITASDDSLDPKTGRATHTERERKSSALAAARVLLVVMRY